jgi:hypothetical protein
MEYAFKNFNVFAIGHVGVVGWSKLAMLLNQVLLVKGTTT